MAMLYGASTKAEIPLPPYRRDTGPVYPSLGVSGTQPAIVKPKYEGEMLKRELAARSEIERKKTCVAPLHKGNYIYVTEGIDPKGLGRKNEVL